MREVVLYGRPGCCLCDDARAALHRVRDRVPFTLSERNIESDAELHRRYLERIPVVTVDGVQGFEFFVDEDALEALLAGGPAQSHQ